MPVRPPEESAVFPEMEKYSKTAALNNKSAIHEHKNGTAAHPARPLYLAGRLFSYDETSEKKCRNHKQAR